MGSHLDTVDSGGRFDGAVGVLAGLEVMRRVTEERITTHHPLGLVVFTNEEGARYRTDMLGSQAFIGALNRDVVYAIRGQDGSLVGEELKRIGYAGDFPCGTIKPHAYLEMHIEQGPLLEEMGTQIGVVEAITGILWLELRLLGAANHAGTTPMDHRQDAALAAARIISALPGLAAGIPGTRATCGQIALAPGVINVIAGEAVMSMDLRHGEAERLADVERHFHRLVREVCAETNVEAEINILGQAAPSQCSRAVVEEIEASCRLLGYTSHRMISGAGHDAQFMARICPTAMIFIPSRGGISHSPKEFSSAAELDAGANVLLQTALRLVEGL
jgi:N-carbamoyl-L-amino-acid hydrolase